MKNKSTLASPGALFPFILLLFAESLPAQSLPNAVDDTLVIYQLDPTSFYLLENDILNGETPLVSLVTAPLTGMAVLSQEGLLTYTPPEFDCSKPFSEHLSYSVCNTAGCDTAQVLIRGLCEGLRVYNGFSPNGDGVNDHFRIDGLHRYGTHAIWIFNRWGEVVFHSTDYRNDWDGTWKNRQLPEGTYFFLIEYGQDQRQTGYLQLER